MIVSFDTETWPILPGLLAPKPVCVSLRTGALEPVLHDADRGATAIEYALDLGYTLIGHNVAFDLAVLAAYRPHLIPKVFDAYKAGRVRDTKIRQQLLDIESGMQRVHGRLFVKRGGDFVPARYDLGTLSAYWLGKDRTAEKESASSWRLRYHELDGEPIAAWPSEAVDYALEDADDPYEIWQRQGPDLLVNEAEQNYAAWGLHLISCWGLRTDGAYVDQLEKETRAKFKAVQDRLFAEGFYRLEPLTPSEIAEGAKADGIMPETFTATGKRSVVSGRPAKYVKNTAVIRDRVAKAFRGAPPKTDRGAVKTDSDTLEQTGDELLMELGDNGPIGTVLRTFVPTMHRGRKHPINTRFNSLLETGRVSSAEPNLNNLPREGGVREGFVPRPGFWFCSVDYDCAELRALGQVCLWLFGKSEIAAFFQRDPEGDPHLELAATILGVTYEEAKKRKKQNDPEIKHIRQGCKALNFGFPGGLGIEKFIALARKNYGVVFTESEAKHRKKQWLERWPEMDRYFRHVSQLVGFNGASVMQLRPDGAVHRRRGEVGYCDCLNGWFQGLIADAAKHALTRLSEECYVDCGTALYGSRPVVHLYDEHIVEVPIDIAHEAAFRTADVMISAAQEWIPDVPMRATPALMERWYKGAEAVYENKRLVPWRPT
jgi:DNA polymerase-1